MLNALISWSLNHRGAVVIGALALAAFGFLSLRELPIDAFPDTTPIQVQINTAVPSLSPEEVERQVTAPIEQTISGLPRLKNVRSISN